MTLIRLWCPMLYSLILTLTLAPAVVGHALEAQSHIMRAAPDSGALRCSLLQVLFLHQGRLLSLCMRVVQKQPFAHGNKAGR